MLSIPVEPTVFLSVQQVLEPLRHRFPSRILVAAMYQVVGIRESVSLVGLISRHHHEL